MTEKCEPHRQVRVARVGVTRTDNQEWTKNGQRMDEEWTKNGRRKNEERTKNGRRMNEEWTKNGRRMDEDKVEIRWR